jgi:hypothetical protein
MITEKDLEEFLIKRQYTAPNLIHLAEICQHFNLNFRRIHNAWLDESLSKGEAHTP